MNHSVAHLDSNPTPTPQSSGHVEPISMSQDGPQTKRLGKNAQKRLLRKQMEEGLGPLPKIHATAQPATGPKKKKRAHMRSTEAKARRLGAKLRKWMIKLPSQNGFLHDVSVEALDLFDGSKRPTTAMVAQSLESWSVDPTTYTEAPTNGIFLLRRDASGLDDFDEDPDDLGVALAAKHRLSHVEPVGEDGCGLPPTSSPVPLVLEPDYALIRYELRLSPSDEARLSEAVVAMRKALTHGGCDHRGQTESWHVGVWSKYRHVPHMTAVVAQQSNEAKNALNKYAGLVGELVVKPVAALIKALDPSYYRLATRVNIYVHLACEESDPLTPNLKWGPLFNVAALRWGAGSVAHLDFDPAELYAFLLADMKFTGGRFCLPHAELAIPFGPYTVILVQAGKLVHFTEEFQGLRFIFTGFIDYNTAIQAGIHCKEFLELSDDAFMVWIKARVEAQWAKERAMEDARAKKLRLRKKA
ncbi:hypothetical protein FRC04_006572 [Tulasnella sp. 424]|nr:hypothetical protein FRC04_006572 [Tulasnella sp. 424]KAG8960981.1 hypothetical protein FRC05_006419 [Tulasnella sp. 425]